MLNVSTTQKEQCYIKSKAHLEQHSDSTKFKHILYMETHKQDVNAIRIYFPANTSQSLRLKVNIYPPLELSSH